MRPTSKFNQPNDYAEDAGQGKTDDGYSCIKPTNKSNESPVGYTAPNNGISTRFEHGYASIADTNIESNKYEEDIYTSIPHESMIASTTSSIATLRPSTSSDFSISSDGKKLSSPSSDSDTNTSIQYNRMQAIDGTHPNNYESSDTDSTYETLREKSGDGGRAITYNEADIKYDTLKRSGSFTKNE